VEAVRPVGQHLRLANDLEVLCEHVLVLLAIKHVEVEDAAYGLKLDNGVRGAALDSGYVNLRGICISEVQADKVNIGGRVKLHNKERVLSVALPLALTQVVAVVGVTAGQDGVVAGAQKEFARALAQSKEAGGLHAETKLLEMIHHNEALVYCCQN